MKCFKKKSVLLVILAVSLVVSILSQLGGRVEATRVLQEDHFVVNHGANTPIKYEKAKFVLTSSFEQLDSGPSPSGPGH
ncbi:Transmembrane protein [Parasponia andersonii]|uniref:Transmembrane protein n=1 Tax=Parasponia andersonii TaxID=3476 RepID=A0A2P5DWN1_PARAD|nr:Transmembrane protein [Parasponia andersonii]